MEITENELIKGLHELKLTKPQLFEKERHQTSLSVDWSSYSYGTKKNELHSPFGIAIHPISEKIYVCDYNGNKVNVCTSNGQYLFSLRNTMAANPFYVYCDQKFTFVLCSLKLVCIFALDGEYVTSARISNAPSAICSDIYPDSVAVCDYEEPTIHFMSRSIHAIEYLKLDTSHPSLDIGKAKKLHFRDVRIIKTGIIMLCNSHSCLLEFSHTGSLNRLISKNKLFLFARCFIIDDNESILVVSDYRNNCIKMYNYQLEKNTSLLGDERILYSQEIYQPRGIAIDSLNRIIVVNSKPNNCLQAFKFNHN